MDGIRSAAVDDYRLLTMTTGEDEMKRVFLASTALMLTAGLAAAEVSVGGDGRMGVKSLDGGDVEFSSRVRVSFSASGESDNGLSFGGSIRADNANGGASGMSGSFSVSGAFGTLAMGDTDTAAKAAVGNVGAVGYTDLNERNKIRYLRKTAPNALWSYSMGDLDLYASADNNVGDGEDRTFSGAMGYSIGTVGVGVGVERDGDMQNVVASVNAGLGDASVKLVFGSYDDDDSATDDDAYAASASFVSGPATFSAYFSSNPEHLANTGGEHFGIGAAFDLGGGAVLKGGFEDGDGQEDASFDLGISMSF